MYPTPWTVDVLPYQGMTPDRLGNETPAWGLPVTKRVYGWAPAGTDEVNGWRHNVTADLQVYGPPDFTAEPRDRMVVDGRTYEVEGEVEDFGHGPFGFNPGVRVNLRRVEGAS
jgi:hypothetical protein